jgi:putative transposase
MKKRHTPEQIVRKLREAEAELAAGASVPEVAKRLGISEATFHRWRNQYGGMKADAMKRLKELVFENARLKKIRRRGGFGHEHPKGGEPKKLLSVRPGGGRPLSTYGGRSGSPNVGLAGRSVNPGLANATWLEKQRKRRRLAEGGRARTGVRGRGPGIRITSGVTTS